MSLSLGPFVFLYEYVEEKVAGQGDNIVGILGDDGDETARCSVCHAFFLCPHKPLAG